MIVGAFGEAIFDASSLGVCTFRQLDRQRSYSFAEHKVVHGLPQLQHTGRALDTITLPIVMDRAMMLYYDCGKTRDIFVSMAETGEPFPLVIGLNYYGLWVLTDIKEIAKTIISNVIIRMDLSLSLKEYN